MKTEETDYEPFGPEWEKEMKKLPKPFLIDMIRKRSNVDAFKEKLKADLLAEHKRVDAINSSLSYNRLVDIIDSF